MKIKSDARKSPRHGCLVPVEAKKKSVFGISKTVDISCGGLGLVLKKSVPVGHRIGIEIQLDDSHESVIAVGEIRWIQKVSGSSVFRAGICLKSHEPRLHNRLMNFLVQKDMGSIAA